MNNKMKSTTCAFRHLTLLGALLLLGAINPAHAITPTVVVPNGDANVEGNSNNGYPFDLGGVGLTSQRYQQVYAADQFSGIPSGGGLITEIVFRPDAFSVVRSRPRYPICKLIFRPPAPEMMGSARPMPTM